MHPFRTKDGFSLLEVLVVLGISVLLIGASGLMLRSNSNGLRAAQTATTATSLIKSAQSRARQQESDVRWGVHIDNTTGDPVFYSTFMVDEDLLAETLFTGVPGTTTDTFAFPRQITSVNPPLGTTMRIIFEKGSGLPANATSVILQVGNDATSAHTINVDANGRIGE